MVGDLDTTTRVGVMRVLARLAGGACKTAVGPGSQGGMGGRSSGRTMSMV